MTPQEYEKAKAQIEHIAKECANDNWGGQRSVSITPKSIEAAKELLNRIHDTAMPPIITPLLDAIIEFSWESGHPDINHRFVAIHIFYDGSLSYGYSVNMGMRLSGIPEELMSALEKIRKEQPCNDTP